MNDHTGQPGRRLNMAYYPYLFYILGSLCFIMGSVIALVNMKS